MSEQASRDRLELWRLRNFLSVNGTTPAQRERGLRLYRYLCATCEHEWTDVSGWGGCPKGTRQCQHCSHVVQPDETAPKVGCEESIRAWAEMNPDLRAALSDRPAPTEGGDA